MSSSHRGSVADKSRDIDTIRQSFYLPLPVYESLLCEKLCELRRHMHTFVGEAI